MTPWRIISQPKPRHVHKFSVATHFHVWMLRDSGAPYGSPLRNIGVLCEKIVHEILLV